MRVKAYAILDGGGVKGAALAGCLEAAEQRGMGFVGYGGTSAGSIVALLAAVGYRGRDLRKIMVEDIQFTDFLDDSGKKLDALKQRVSKAEKALWPFKAFAYWQVYSSLGPKLGLYSARNLKAFLVKKVKDRLKDFAMQPDITFSQLKDKELPLLKIVASDLRTRGAKIYSCLPGEDEGGSIFDAVRASMSYPFIFQPVPVNDRYLVDGGLSSNLPVFLFERERKEEAVPVFAFDLLSPEPERGEEYGIREFCWDMLSTALESNDSLMRKVLPNSIYHIQVPVPAGIGTLDFDLSRERREELYNAGFVATTEFFNKNLPQLNQVRNSVEALQALFVPARIVTPLLAVVAREFAEHTGATNVRANIMLPTDRGSLLVVYQYGMDTDPDIDLELPSGAGCSGIAWQSRDLNAVDLVEVRRDPTAFGLTQAQQNRVRGDRQAVLSVPIYEWLPAPLPLENLIRLGVLSVDTDTSLDGTRWITDHKMYVRDAALRWTEILAKVLEKG